MPLGDCEVRLRRGPDGTVAVWKRWAGIEPGHELVHWLPDGTLLGPVRTRTANEARWAMERLRATWPPAA